MQPDNPDDVLLGQLLVTQGACTRERVEEALAALRSLRAEGAAAVPTLGEFLVRQGHLTSAQAAPPLPESKYRREGLLGSGGMGEVWKAWDTELERWVALKFLKGGDVEERARFRREAQMAAKLSHPNICAVYDAQESFIAMQYVEGRTLASHVRGDRRRVVGFVRDAARAVHHAHEHGVIHRDLKPANVMVEEKSQRVCVMDFGLAKATNAPSGLSVSGLIMGTPSYMSPEQAQGLRSVDARSDVYSLGATLYELLAGRPPFAAASAYECLRRVIEEDPAPPRAGVELDAIALKCLEKDPTRRYASAQELADDLTRWLDGEPVRARGPSIVYRWRKALARRRALAVVFFTAAFAVAAAVGYALVLRPQAQAKLQEDAVFGPIREKLRLLPDTREGWSRACALWGEGLGRYDRSWEAWMRKGELHEQLGEEEAALTCLQRALALNPRLSAAHYRRGRILQTLNRNDEALAEFERAIAVDPANEYAVVGRATIALLRDDYEGAMRLCDEAQPRAGRVPDLHFVRGVLHSRPGAYRDLSRAIACYSESIRLDPRRYLAWLNRGSAFLDSGDAEAAGRDIATALGLNPDSPGAHAARASLCAHHERWAEAEAEAAEAIRINAAIVSAWIVRAEARRHQGRLDAAMSDCESAIRLDAKNAAAHDQRGMVRRERGDRAGARSDYDRAVALDPRHGPAYVHRALLNMEEDRLDDAIVDFGRAIGAGTSESIVYYNRGLAWAQKGDGDRAAADFEQAIRLDPANLEARIARAVVHLRARRLNEALADLDEVLRKAPRNPDALFNRGNVLVHLGENEKAVRDLVEALRVAPEDWEYRDVARRQLEELRKY